MNRTSVTPPAIRYYRSLTRVDICPCYRKYWKLNTGHRIENMAIDLEVLDRKAAADDEINWVTAIFMGLFHVGAIAALFFFTWKAFLVSMFLWWVSGSLGIGMGYHRLLTHRGYKTPKWVEYILTTCARWRLRADRFSGWPRTASIISIPIRKAIRIRRATASGGRTWAGS